MTDSSRQAPDQQLNGPKFTGLRRRIAGMRGVAFAVIASERILVAALPVLGVIALFLTFSWFGLWRFLTDWAKIVATLAFVVALAGSLWRFRRFRWPLAAAVDRRLEARSGLSHQAISIQTEEPVGDDPFGRALWRAHQARMAATIKAIDSGLPSPDIARHDPFAARAVVVLLLFVAWSFSWSNYGGRVRDAFDYSGTVATASNLRIDAWVTPPSYTGVAPIYLSGAQVKAPEGLIKVPQFSELAIHIAGEDADSVTFTPAESGKPVALAPEKAASEKAPDSDQADAAAKNTSYKLKLTRDGEVAVGHTHYAFSIITDKKPDIAFSKEPDRAVNGALEIAFEAKDDYGVTEAHAEIVPAVKDPQALALFDPPKYPLDLPGGNPKDLKGTTSRDLTEHPLSGTKVKITLVARDAAGLEGRSETKEIVLPARYFTEPVAGSIAEQRQVFSLNIRNIRRAIELNDAAGFRAEETIPNVSQYLLLQSVRNRLMLSRTIAELGDTAAYFWDVARYIEDGDLSSAEKRLKNAQDRLSEALKHGASDKEIEKLMSELRKAMKDYLAELAKRMQNGDKTQLSQQAQRMMRAQDFDNMLNQLENLARSGSREQAQQLLSEMQRMLNNMQTARRNDQQQNNPMREQIDRLGKLMQQQQKLMQQQQKLMEDTHRTEQALRDRMQRGDPGDENQGLNDEPLTEQAPQDRPQKDPGKQSAEDKMTAEQLRQALKDMKKRQSELQKDLGGLQKKLGEMGLKGPQGFKDAGKEMGESADALGKSQGQRSADAQGRALDALRKGAGDLMQQLSQAGRNGPQGMMPVPGEEAQGNDPLGRRSGQLGSEIDDQVKVPDQIDVQRAREILDAIRRKLGDGPSSIIEKEYLERLLDLK
jgi:uncharacterized protein (TIGR02302 family)